MKPINRLPSEWRAADPPERKELNYLRLSKGDERYIFIYDEDSRAETLRTMGRFASNPEISFTWYDAAKLAQKIREEAKADAVRKFTEAAEPWRQSLED